MYRFRATIEKEQAAANSWCVVRLPADVALALKGARRVAGTIASAAFEGSVISRGNGVKCVIVKRALRGVLGLEPGQEIELAIDREHARSIVEVPLELALVFDQNPAVAAVFARLSPSHQREYADWIAQAKKTATKTARAERALAMIAQKRHVKE